MKYSVCPARMVSGRANDFKFTGQQLDSETVFYYLRARHYGPAIGRFPTRDSFCGWVTSPRSQNPYAYVTNNPVFYVDPLGLWGLGDLADAAGGIGDALGNAADTFGDALGDLELDDLGYIDLNGTVCLGLCLTGGLQASFGEGFHPYVGRGIGRPNWQGMSPSHQVSTLLLAGIADFRCRWARGLDLPPKSAEPDSASTRREGPAGKAPSLNLACQLRSRRRL